MVTTSKPLQAGVARDPTASVILTLGERGTQGSPDGQFTVNGQEKDAWGLKKAW